MRLQSHYSVTHLIELFPLDIFGCWILLKIILVNCRCMASSLVRTGFVRGSMTQGNGCYQHRCVNNSLEVCHCLNLLSFHEFSV